MANVIKHTAPANHEHPGTAQLFAFPSPPAAPARRRRALPHPAAESARIYRLGDHLTPADCAFLAAWINDPAHGYDRLLVERCAPGAAAWASFALVYVPAQAWSVWGLARRMGEVEVWRCATGETLGLHPTMPAALASLPHAAEHRRILGQPAGPASIQRTGSGVR